MPFNGERERGEVELQDRKEQENGVWGGGGTCDFVLRWLDTATSPCREPLVGPLPSGDSVHPSQLVFLAARCGKPL